MHPLEISTLLHRALAPRVSRLLELTREDGWWEDAELLHQARVASRRLRAVLHLLDPKLYPGLKRQQRRLEDFTKRVGTIRELDVHNQLLEELGPELPGPHGWAALEHILERLAERRSQARKSLPAQIRAMELPKLSALLPEPDIPFPFHAVEPAEAAWGHMRPFVEAISAALPGQQRAEDPAALHLLRIQAKKLRYLVEILAPVFVREAEAPLRELKALQTVLGDYHDYAALEAELQPLQEGLEARFRRVLAEGLQEVLFLLSRERGTHYDRFREIADLYMPPAFARELRSRLGLPGDSA